MRKNIFFLPVSLPFFIFLLGLPFLLLALASLLEWNLAVALREALGLSVLEAVALYVTLLAAGFVNLPVFEFKSRRDSEQKHVSYLGRKYPLPVWHGHNTVVSVNLGGGVLALLASAYLAQPLPLATTLLSVAIVALGIFLLSKPSRSAGFYVPALAPPLLSLLVALAGLYLNGGELYDCARLAFVAGTAGTLVGTTLLNLPRLEKLGTSSINVGGLGTFDGIVLTGLLSTIVACLLVPA
jgi:uncharacterized membrane protein